MSTDNESTDPRPNKRKKIASLNHQDKKPNLAIDDVGLSTNVESNGDAASESLKKYENISRLELEELCERWMLYDSTGIYIPPTDFKINCQKRKGKPNKRSESLVETNNKNQSTTFGKGRIGVASDKFGTKICTCNPILTDINSKVLPRNLVMACNNNCVKRKTLNTNDYSEPGCSGFQTRKEENDPAFKNFTMQEMDCIMSLVDNSFKADYALDLSMVSIKSEQDVLTVSDLSGTTVINESIPDIAQATDGSESSVDFLALNEVNENEQNERDTVIRGPHSDNEQMTQNTNVINILDVTNVENSIDNVEVVDLTNVSFSVPLLPINHSEIIELLDDTIQTTENQSMTPRVIETIDLVDSDSDSEWSNKRLLNKITSPLAPKIAMECPICLENLKGKKIMTTICGHIFCSKCIRNAIKTKKNCPNCRKKLNSNGIHPLYFNF